MASGNAILEPIDVSGEPLDVAAWAADMSDDALSAALCEASAAVSATQARMAIALAVFSDREGHAGWGINSLGHWGAINLGTSNRQAEALAATGRAAVEMDALRDAWQSGALSTEKARIVGATATPDSVDKWIGIAMEASGSQLARIASAYRSSERHRSDDEPAPPPGDRSRDVGLWWHNRDDGLVKLVAILEPDDAALVKAALDKILEDGWRASSGPDASAQPDAGGASPGASGDAPAEPTEERGPDEHAAAADVPAGDTGDPDIAPDVARDVDDTVAASAQARRPADGPRRRAEALAALAESGLATGPVPMVGGERTVVHLGIDLDYLAGIVDEGQCHLWGLGAVDRATASMLACDARIRAFVRNADGHALDLGREQRLVNTRQRRLLHLRDGGCSYPGCTNRLYVDAHHAIPWTDGGRTDMDNLLLLCRMHHRAQHRGEFRIEALGGGRFRFLDPRGRELGPPRRRGSPPPDLTTPPGATTRARSGGDPNYSLDLTVQCLAG